MNQFVSKGAVLVTGSSSGIGRACALELAAHGYHVFAGVRNAADGEKLRSEAKGNLEPLILEVTDTANIAAVARRIDGTPLVALINNAGVCVSGPLDTLSMDRLRQQYEINLIGPIALTQALLSQLVKSRGYVLNISSGLGKVAPAFMGPYASSKHAIEAWSASLRRELQSVGVKVVTLAPGAIMTQVWKKMAEDARAQSAAASESFGFETYERALAKMIRLAEQAKTTPQDVAAVAIQVLNDPRPKNRYAIGSDAKAGAFAARFLPDALIDKFV